MSFFTARKRDASPAWTQIRVETDNPKDSPRLPRCSPRNPVPPRVRTSQTRAGRDHLQFADFDYTSALPLPLPFGFRVSFLLLTSCNHHAQSSAALFKACCPFSDFLAAIVGTRFADVYELAAVYFCTFVCHVVFLWVTSVENSFPGATGAQRGRTADQSKPASAYSGTTGRTEETRVAPSCHVAAVSVG